MKSKEVIRQIQEADPSGEVECCVGNTDIHFIELLPAYYDGALQVLKRDETSKYYNIIGGKYVRTGNKVKFHTLTIADAVLENSQPFEVDYSELNPDTAKSVKESHDKIRQCAEDIENKHEWDHFYKWAKAKAEAITVDLEDFEYDVRAFCKKNIDRNAPLPKEALTDGRLIGKSYNDARYIQWDLTYRVNTDNGFLKISKIGEVDEEQQNLEKLLIQHGFEKCSFVRITAPDFYGKANYDSNENHIFAIYVGLDGTVKVTTSTYAQSIRMNLKIRNEYDLAELLNLFKAENGKV